jgi:hypothetical protein
MNFKRSLLIILLAAWLPIQSLAGTLLHCELMEHSSLALGEIQNHHELHVPVATPADNVMPIGHAQSAPLESAQLEDCHGQSAVHKPIELIESPALNDEAPCNHCNGSCHGIQQLSLPTLDNGFISSLNTFSPSYTAAEISSIPENPQRPPKLS